VSHRPEKILALQFKYFGDAVLLTPALRALREKFPQAEIHVLVSQQIAPLFQHLPWITRVWAMPRRRGSAALRETWPFIRALRRERFDRSVDFASNDRGAILSLLIGARQRLGWSEVGGFLGRRLCYNQHVVSEKNHPHEALRLLRLLSAWQVPPPSQPEAEIRANPALAETARQILPATNAILCHVASSQQKKEWPVKHWVELLRLARAAGLELVFTTAQGEREATLMTELRQLAPEAHILPPVPDLARFLAVLARAKAFVSGDTGPLHFAAGLGIPTLSLFGPTPPDRWAPLGRRHQHLISGACHCDSHSAICTAPRHCLAEITPAQVLSALQRLPTP
jgi:heptosyltransferase III